MLDGGVRHQQSMFKIKILSVLCRALDGLLHESTVFRMGALDNELHGRLCRPVELEDPKGFLRPDDLARGDTPAEAAGVA